jgi:transcriptional antiterminator NusG
MSNDTTNVVDKIDDIEETSQVEDTVVAEAAEVTDADETAEGETQVKPKAKVEGAVTDDEEYYDEDDENVKWYVVHTYSGYENKVKANLEKIIENRGMQDLIWEIIVPMEEQIEIKDGRRKSTFKKVFPGYVLIKMVMTDETWYIVRNATGVTGFVGPESKAVPLTAAEIRKLGIEEVHTTVDFEVNDRVIVTEGALENFVGTIKEIHMDKKKVLVLVSMFGRETPVELEFTQISRI